MNFLASKRLVTAALALLVVANVTLLSLLCWQKSCRMGVIKPHPFRQHEAFLEPIDLNATQTISFRKLRQAHFLKVQPEMESIARLKKELVKESLKDHPENATIEKIASTIGAHHATIERELAAHFHELAQVCTPAQCDSLEQMLNRIAAHKQAMRMERWREHRP